MNLGTFHAEFPPAARSASHYPPPGPFYRPSLGTEADINGWLSDAALGDEYAFSRLFISLWTPVVHTTYGVIGDMAHAEEVAQEVMLEAWRKASAFDPMRGSARAWLYTIGRRRAIDRLRTILAARRRDHQHFTDRSGPGRHATDTGDNRLDDHTGVRAAVLQLTALQREALSLTFTAGMTHLAAAQYLGIPEGTFKSRVRQALTRSRHLISRDLLPL